MSGPIPGIAGRSPSYLVRQLYDIREGKRAGATAELMKLCEKSGGPPVEDCAQTAPAATSIRPPREGKTA